MRSETQKAAIFNVTIGSMKYLEGQNQNILHVLLNNSYGIMRGFELRYLLVERCACCVVLIETFKGAG